MYLCVICVCLVFSLKSVAAKLPKEQKIEFSCYINNAKNTDEASLLLWNWLLSYTGLSAQHAALHNIYEKNTHAIFYDLDGDRVREILGTHDSTTISGMGNNLLYILKYDEKAKSKYKKISKDLYFNAHKPLSIFYEEKNKYKKIRAVMINNTPITFSFDKRKNIYIEK